MSEEKSGMDLLQEILFKINTIEQFQKILDQNQKILINKVNEITVRQKVEHQNAKIEEKQQAKSGFSNFKFEPSDPTKITKGIVVKGRMVAQDGMKKIGLPKLVVKIYDDKDNFIKETRTNIIGEWSLKLGPGKYVALFEGQFNGKPLVPQNRNFIVPNQLPQGQNELEIA